MATLTIKNLPDEIYAALSKRAKQNRRSINSEAIVLGGLLISTTLASGFFLSLADQTITFNVATNYAHGLGAKPFFYIAYLKCITADAGYAVGDEVFFNNADIAGTNGTTISVDATNITVANLTSIRLHNKSTLAATTLTAARWVWAFRLFL